MNLSTLHFTYELEDDSFTDFRYSFRIGTDEKEAIVPTAKKSMSILETIIEETYSVDDYDKKRTGKVTPSVVTKGYTYKQKDPDYRRRFLTNIEYTVRLNPSSNPSSLSLNVSTIDSEERNLLNIYDEILRISQLQVSKEAKVQKDNIKRLRQGFDEDTYLQIT